MPRILNKLARMGVLFLSLLLSVTFALSQNSKEDLGRAFSKIDMPRARSLSLTVLREYSKMKAQNPRSYDREPRRLLNY